MHYTYLYDIFYPLDSIVIVGAESQTNLN